MILVKFKWDEKHSRIQTFSHPLLTSSKVLTSKDDIKLEYNTQICSYNIKFLSIYVNKNLDYIGKFLKEFCDIVVIQENTASPYFLCPDEKMKKKVCRNAKNFEKKINEMGFYMHISGENTGKTNIVRNHLTSEWPTFLYKPEKIRIYIPSQPHYMDTPIRQHPIFERVPYIVPLLINGKHKLNIVNIHLHPGNSNRSKKKRKIQIKQLISLLKNFESEQTILAGDFNISDINELQEFSINKYSLANGLCIATNAKYRTNEECYDHIILNEIVTKSNRHMKNIQVLDVNFLFEKSLKGFLNINDLEQIISDHLPIIYSIEFR